MASELDLNYEKLDEYIEDENKVITYKWLSHELCLPVNMAKQTLYSYVVKRRKEKGNEYLHVTYLLCGTVTDNTNTDNNKINKVVIVNEERLEAVKKTFSSLSATHVYSIQKSLLEDLNTLYAVDFDINNSSHPPIQCSTAVLRKCDENKSTSKPAQAPTTSTKTTTGDKKETDKPTSKTSSSGPSASRPASAATNNSKTKKNIKGQKSALQMFANAPAKKPTVNTEKLTTKPAEKCSVKSAKDNKSESKHVDQKSEVVKNGSNPEEVKHVNGKSEPVTKLKPKSPSDDKPAAVSRRKNSRKKTTSDSNSDIEDPKPKHKKRRRRIQQPESDSSEDEQPHTSHVEEVTEPVHDNNNGQETEVKENVNDSGKKGKNVLKTKTSVNEEGFMVTEKVWEFETMDASDPEDPLPTSKVLTKNTATKKTEPAPGKAAAKKGKAKIAAKPTHQASMMSFFKKV